ncbi:MAG: cupin domain-containing protein [Candidatus Latescibacterota bacterium]|nr:cupin domain-containing protein [Candidatus Latescibacterota bacterium]
MTIRPGHILSAIAADDEEQTQTLVQRPGLHVQRIVSPPGFSMPEGEWFDQDVEEWVLVLQGRAGLRVGHEAGEVIVVNPGDHLLIPPHTRHRVEWTDPQHLTIWLAVHWESVVGQE